MRSHDPKLTRCIPCIGLMILLLIAWAPLALAGKKAPDRRITTKLKLAQSFYLNGRNGDALRTVNGVLKESSRYVQAHQLRGQILFTMNEVEDALAEFDRALRLNKNYTEARNWRAYALVQLERYDEAMEEYERALADLTYPTPEKIRTNVGMLYRLRGQYDKAIVSLQKAVQLNPSYTKGFYELGITYREMGNGGKAKEYFESVIKLAPDTPVAGQARDQIEQLQADS